LASIVPGSGINTDYFRSASTGKGVNDNHVFLLVARMLRDKGVNEFVEAARLIRDKQSRVRFQLLGPLDVENNTAISSKTIDAWVAEGVVEYYPSVDDVRPYLEKASCVVLPSYREGLPRTLLEAAAMGKPLIATDTPGCRDVVLDGENGYLCRVADMDDLAKKMQAMVDLSLDERAEMGKVSRLHIVENFDDNRVISCYLDAIDGLSRFVKKSHKS
jgi:glycosyltransferase involved in cell wall biosynthesis